jgi:coenzyme F420-reducing hydrogenase alpha subunit
MGFDPGRVRLTLSLDGEVVERAELSCERPVLAKLLRGKPADQAVALVPLIYSLCGKAQGIAARAALAAARGSETAGYVDAEAWGEAAREHAWKLFVDWPRQLGLTPDEEFFVRLARCLPEQKRELAVAATAQALPGEIAAHMGRGEIDGLLAARVAARLTQLLDWLLDRPGTLGRVSATAVAPGIGEARVETARGELRHRLELAGDAIADYRIVAPTDVHFAASGDAVAWLGRLRGLPVAMAQAQAQRLVMAFDPCVPWECAFA